jgi:Protein of unknown function (DUF3108)
VTTGIRLSLQRLFSTGWRRTGLALLWYLFLTVALTWPLARFPFTKLAALHGPGDPFLNLWILGWDLRTLSQSPVDILTGRVFEANIFHPARQTLAYSDHFIPVALVVWPFHLLTGNVVFAYNVAFVFALFASACAMHLFVREITGSTWAAIFAGTVWGFWPYHFAHLGHIQLQATFLLPITFLFLHRLVAGNRIRDAIGLGLATALQATWSVYYGVIGVVALGVAAVALALSTGGRRLGLLVRRLAIGGLVGAVLVAPFIWPYLQVQQREGFTRTLFEASRHSAQAQSYVSAPEVNLLYGATGWLRTDRGAESELFPGFMVIALAVAGLVTARRAGSWPTAATAAAVALTGFLLSFGPDGVRLLYATLHRWMFGFQAIRAPARFAVLVTFGLAVLAALAIRELEARTARAVRLPATKRQVAIGTVACVLAVALAAVEYLNVPLRWVDAPRLSTHVGAWLRSASGPGAVVYLPVTNDIANTPVMVESLEHGRPIVNGYSGQRPAFFAGVVDALHAFPSAEAMWTLAELNVRFVVTETPLDTATWPLVERMRAPGEGHHNKTRFVYELNWSPEAAARFEEPAAPEPPPPGPIPFEAGERLTFHVTWDGPAGAVSAGTVTLEAQTLGRGGGEGNKPGADAPKSSAPVREPAWRFDVAARTAPWVARFFEADDRFVTATDATLHPLWHERRLREGRRAVDERLAFDREARRVHAQRLDGSPAGPDVRMAPYSRDAVSAFYYVRTLALSPGDRLEIPVVENGRQLRLVLQAADRETIQVGDVSTEALRLEAGLVQRVPRRTPPRLTVWLTSDARRLPVLAEVDAVFGKVRLRLAKVEATAAVPSE